MPVMPVMAVVVGFRLIAVEPSVNVAALNDGAATPLPPRYVPAAPAPTNAVVYTPV